MKVSPFRPILFRKGADHFFSPPFDTINTAERLRLRAFPFNITHLTLPDSNESALRTFGAWMNEGVLQQLQDDTVLVLEQQFIHSGKEATRLGVICLVRVFPESEDIKPHELTFPGPRKGRYSLISSIKCEPEPIFLITPFSGMLEKLRGWISDRKPYMKFEEPSGVMNSIYTVNHADALKSFAESLSHEIAIVADGHHRLAAVREIAAEHSAKGDSRWNSILAYLAPSESNSLFISGIHRVVKNTGGREFSSSSIGSYFDVSESSKVVGGKSITIYDGETTYAVPSEKALKTFPDLDLNNMPDVVNRLLLKGCLGLSESEMETLIAYNHSREESMAAVDSGEAAFAILMPDWDPTEFAKIISGGRLLPQKSTFFFPKVPSGIALFAPETQQAGY